MCACHVLSIAYKQQQLLDMCVCGSVHVVVRKLEELELQGACPPYLNPVVSNPDAHKLPVECTRFVNYKTQIRCQLVALDPPGLNFANSGNWGPMSL